MTARAKRISAVTITVEGGVEATFVQQGEPWNTLREYRCIAPKEFVGERLITAPVVGESGFRVFLSLALYALDEQEQVLLASPQITAALKGASQPTEAGQ